jgi:hypothetical protein
MSHAVTYSNFCKGLNCRYLALLGLIFNCHELLFNKIHTSQHTLSNLILPSVGVPASLNNCGGSGRSRKAISELGHCDNQQPTTGNSLPPNNPPPSSASVPHTPAGTLRRGHRNLQLLRPQVRCHHITLQFYF